MPCRKHGTSGHHIRLLNSESLSAIFRNMTLRDWLEQHELTQKEFAARLGLQQPSVARWLRRNSVPADRVPEVARITGLPYSRLNKVFGKVAA